MFKLKTTMVAAAALLTMGIAPASANCAYCSGWAKGYSGAYGKRTSTLSISDVVARKHVKKHRYGGKSGKLGIVAKQYNEAAAWGPGRSSAHTSAAAGIGKPKRRR